MRVNVLSSFSTTLIALIEAKISWSLVENPDNLFLFGTSRKFFYEKDPVPSYFNVLGYYDRAVVACAVHGLRKVVRTAEAAGNASFRRADKDYGDDYGWGWLVNRLDRDRVTLTLTRDERASLDREFRTSFIPDTSNLALIQRRAHEAGCELVDPVMDLVPA